MSCSPHPAPPRFPERSSSCTLFTPRPVHFVALDETSSTASSLCSPSDVMFATTPSHQANTILDDPEFNQHLLYTTAQFAGISPSSSASEECLHVF